MVLYRNKIVSSFLCSRMLQYDPADRFVIQEKTETCHSASCRPESKAPKMTQTSVHFCVCVCFCKQGLIGVFGVFLCCLFSAEIECIGITAGTTC